MFLYHTRNSLYYYYKYECDVVSILGGVSHECLSCELKLLRKEDYVNHLRTADIHTSSLQNHVCQGDRNPSRACRNAEDLNRQCMSHSSLSPTETQENIGFSPLHCTVLNGFRDCAKALLSWGAYPDVKDTLGWTPMHIAASKGYIKIILLLLGHNGNLFELNNNKDTPYDVASFKTKHAILERIFYFEGKSSYI